MICIVSCLQTADYDDANSLIEIFLGKFCSSSKGNASQKICSCFPLSFISSLNSKCIGCHCRCFFTGHISYFRISGKPPHQENFIHVSYSSSLLFCNYCIYTFFYYPPSFRTYLTTSDIDILLPSIIPPPVTSFP